MAYHLNIVAWRFRGIPKTERKQKTQTNIPSSVVTVLSLLCIPVSSSHDERTLLMLAATFDAVALPVIFSLQTVKDCLSKLSVMKEAVRLTTPNLQQRLVHSSLVMASESHSFNLPATKSRTSLYIVGITVLLN